MAYKPPIEIARAGIKTGSTKARLSWDKALVAGFLAGGYIAISGLLAVTVSAGIEEEPGDTPSGAPEREPGDGRTAAGPAVTQERR